MLIDKAHLDISTQVSAELNWTSYLQTAEVWNGWQHKVLFMCSTGAKWSILWESPVLWGEKAMLPCVWGMGGITHNSWWGEKAMLPCVWGMGGITHNSWWLEEAIMSSFYGWNTSNINLLPALFYLSLWQWKWCKKGAFRGGFQQVGVLLALLKNIIITISGCSLKVGYSMFLQELSRLESSLREPLFLGFRLLLCLHWCYNYSLRRASDICLLLTWWLVAWFMSLTSSAIGKDKWLWPWARERDGRMPSQIPSCENTAGDF